MIKFLIQKLLSLILLMVGVSILNTLIIMMIPGDPVVAMLGERSSGEVRERLRAKLGLDQPARVQIEKNLMSLLKFDLGVSIRSNRAVVDELGDVVPVSVYLGALSAFLALFISMLTAFFAIKHPKGLIDRFMGTLVVSIQTVPVFVLALIFILVLGVYANIIPISGVTRVGYEKTFFEVLYHLITPAFILALFPTCMMFRLLKSTMQIEIKKDYIKVARSKGLSENRVILKHLFPNSLISTLTAFGIYFSLLMGGAVLTETVFSLPGLGRYMLLAVQSRDIPAIQACLALVLIFIYFFNALVDFLLVLIDPRRRLASS